MKCDFMNTANICSNLAEDCGRPTRANLFFEKYPYAPHRNGIPLVFPCFVDQMTCDLSKCKPNIDDSHCKLCGARYWLSKICHTEK